MKSPTIRAFLRQMNDRHAEDIDGSYLVCMQLPHGEYAAASHPAYTPRQIEAEKVARARPNVAHVYFIRDTSRPAPYWLSPGHFRDVRVEMKKADSDEKVVLPIRHVVIDVAPSREERRNAVEVLIPVGQLKVMQPKEQEAFVLDHVRKAIAAVVPRPAGAA